MRPGTGRALAAWPCQFRVTGALDANSIWHRSCCTRFLQLLTGNVSSAMNLVSLTCVSALLVVLLSVSDLSAQTSPSVPHEVASEEAPRARRATQNTSDGGSSRLWLVPENALGRKPSHHDPAIGTRYGRLMDHLLRWTEQLIRKLDRLGLLESPWHRAQSDRSSLADSEPRGGGAPRLCPVRLAGDGYGLVARVNF